MELTEKESAIVQVLIGKKGSVVSRSDISKEVFGMKFTLSNLIDAHITNIRRKLGKDSIETVRGSGYRIAI